jgi:hypothetical protein
MGNVYECPGSAERGAQRIIRIHTTEIYLAEQDLLKLLMER